MQHTLKKFPKSIVELVIDLSPEEMRPYLEKAAIKLSTETTIPGFRAGKAPLDEVARRFGTGRVWEEAAVLAVPVTFSQVARDEKLQTIGSPAIEVIKLAPDNPFSFKATVALLPEITLGDFSKIKVEQKTITVGDEQIDKVLADLRKMQTKEVVVSRAARSQGDKIVLDMAMSLDSVPLDGGQAKGHAVYLDENYYIPGLKEQLPGLKKGDVKEFKLKFPKEHYQKMIAGKEVDFKVEVKDVFELQAPPVDDAFAQTIGQKTVADLKALIRKNLENETKLKEAERQEIELLEKLVEQSKFGDIPDILINEETQKMLGELEDGIARQGTDFEAYLKKLGKTREQLRLDFAPQGVMRVKVALAVRTIAAQEKVTISEEEVDAEVKRVLELYKNAPGEHDQIRSEGAREYLATMLRNRKVIDWLKSTAKKRE